MNTNTFDMYSNTNTNTLYFFTKVFEYEYFKKCIRILMNMNTFCPGLVIHEIHKAENYTNNIYILRLVNIYK